MKAFQVIGGLGSQMMAYAAYLKFKEQYKELILDYSDYRYNEAHNGEQLSKLFGIYGSELNYFWRTVWRSRNCFVKAFRKMLTGTHILKFVRPEKFNYDETVFNMRGNILFHQCWISPKYFEGFEEKIKNIYKFPEMTEEKNLEIAKKIRSTDSVCIHVRRGDYLKEPPLAGLAGLDFYAKALKLIEEKIENPTYFVFSDDMKWCKENLKLKNVEYVDWNKKENSFRDMQLMSICKHNIIPNSSFGWWGAWLNDNLNKIVICPERWANPETGIELKDMVPENEGWIKIKNY